MMRQRTFKDIQDGETLYYIDLETDTGGECKADISDGQNIFIAIDSICVDFSMADYALESEYQEDDVAVFVNFDDFYETITSRIEKRLKEYEKQITYIKHKLGTFEETYDIYAQELEDLKALKKEKGET